jgi:hypothetical protein
MNSDKNWKNLISVIIRDLFVASFILFIIFSFLEIIKPKIILNYLDLNIYFLVMILFGLVTIIYFKPEPKEIKHLNFLDYSAIILFSILIGILSFYLTRTIGWLSILVGLIGAVICYYFVIKNYEIPASARLFN